MEEGRGIYANIRKAIHYLLSCNIGEIFTIFLATVLDFRQMPLIPVQLLWLNLVTDSLPALALGVEPVEEDVMEQPPRPAQRQPVLPAASPCSWLGRALLVGAVTLAAYFLGEYILSSPGLETCQAANTMAFATLTLCQLFHAYDVRSDHRSIFELGIFYEPRYEPCLFGRSPFAVRRAPPAALADGVFGGAPERRRVAHRPGSVCHAHCRLRGGQVPPPQSPYPRPPSGAPPPPAVCAVMGSVRSAKTFVVVSKAFLTGNTQSGEIGRERGRFL